MGKAKGVTREWESPSCLRHSYTPSFFSTVLLKRNSTYPTISPTPYLTTLIPQHLFITPNFTSHSISSFVQHTLHHFPIQHSSIHLKLDRIIPDPEGEPQTTPKGKQFTFWSSSSDFSLMAMDFLNVFRVSYVFNCNRGLVLWFNWLNLYVL